MDIERNDTQVFCAFTKDAKFKDEVVIKYDKTLKNEMVEISNSLNRIYISVDDFIKIYECISPTYIINDKGE